jgi:WD40 repeat protein
MPQGPRRTAVLIDITSFDGDIYDADGEPLPGDRRRPDPLPFDGLVDGLAGTLDEFGYRVERPREGGLQLAGASIWPALRAILDDHHRNDVVVVHVLSHGITGAETNSLRVLGRDGRDGAGSDFFEWLRHCLNRADHGPYVLFILDVCHAGQAVLTDEFLRRERPRNVWILAAAAAAQPAFNARLTSAFDTVMRDLLDGRLAIPTDWPLVPLTRFAPEVTAQVERLRTRDRAPRQDVRGTTIDITTRVDHLPFLPNPRFDPHAFDRDRIPRPRQLSGPIEPRDADHFIQAAACHGTSADADTSAFTGRHVELERLTGWLRDPGEHRLHLVTGRAGAGKSALLAVLVCATHGALQWHGDQLRERIPGLPPRRPGLRLAAINARLRDVPRCLAAIGVQLFDDPNIPTVDALVGALLRDGRPVVLAVDGLDEAADPRRLLDELLLPLLKAEGAGGRPACAVLVAARHDAPVATVAAGHAGSGVTNLDPASGEDRRRLESDLTTYVLALLAGPPDAPAPGPRQRPVAGAVEVPAQGGESLGGEVRRALAAAVAARLARPVPGAEPALGEFLVARLYVDELNRQPPPADVAQARALGERVPRSLAGVFELDERLRTYHWLRPVLAAIALGRGYGVPASAIPALAGAVAAAQHAEFAERSVPTGAEVAAALAVAGAYLRIVPGDEVALYQLVHDGLADHLRRHPVRPGVVGGPDAAGLYRALLDSVPAPGGRRIWEGTSAYVRRHVLGFAREAGAVAEVLTDPGYLLAHRPEPLAAVGELAGDPAAPGELRSLAAAAVAVIDLDGALPPGYNQPQRRSRLAVEAVRHQRHDLAGALLADVRGALRPRLVVTSAAGRVAAAPSATAAAIVASADGTPTVRVWNTSEPPQQLPPKVLPSAVTALAVVTHGGGEELAAGCAAGQLWLWPLEGTMPRRKLAGHRSAVRAITMLDAAGPPRLVSVDAHDLQLWDPEFGDLAQLVPLGGLDVAGVVGTALPGGTAGLVLHGRTTAALLELGTGLTPGRTRATWRIGGGFSTVLAFDGAPAVLHWPGDGTVWWLDPLTGRETSWRGDRGHVLAAAAVGGGAEPAVVTGDEAGRLMVWRLERGNVQALGTVTGPVRCLASGLVDGRPLIFCGAGDGTVTVWAYPSRAPLRSLPLGARLLATPIAGTALQPPRGSLLARASQPARESQPVRRRPGVAAGAGFGGVVLAVPGESRVTVHHLPAGGGWPAEHTVPAGDGPVRVEVLGTDGWAAVAIEEAGGRVRAWHPVDGRLLSDTRPGNTLALLAHVALHPTQARRNQATAVPMVTQASSGVTAASGLTLVDGGFVTVGGTADGAITIRPHGGGPATARTIRAHDGAVTAVAAWSDGHRATAASCGGDGQLAVSDMSTGELLAVARLPGPGHGLRVLPTVPGSPAGGRHLLVESGDDTICFEYTPATGGEAP